MSSQISLPLCLGSCGDWSHLHCREMVWLLCVSDSIVELVPSIQQFPGGGTHKVMATRPRSDLYMNLPALKKLDVMLVSIFVGFQDTEKWLPCQKFLQRGIRGREEEVAAMQGLHEPDIEGSNGKSIAVCLPKWIFQMLIWRLCPRSVSSEDGSDQLCGRYSKSVDVSESESSSSIPSGLLARRLENVKSCFPSLQVMLPLVGGKDVVVWDEKTEKEETDLSEIDLMKKIFAKLLLEEDMSGGGKGVCTALAISNAITNLSVTVFWELWRLEPFALQTKAMWRREMVWLLCMRDSIVELVPSIQQFPGGGTYKVMASRPRSDLYMNLPALKKLDAMLVSVLDGFQDMEFCYVDRGIVVADANDGKVYPSAATSGRPSIRQAEKWLPCPKIPPKGLSEDARKKLQQCRDCTNQILKAAMAINRSVLTKMDILNAYLGTLPKLAMSVDSVPLEERM